MGITSEGCTLYVREYMGFVEFEWEKLGDEGYSSDLVRVEPRDALQLATSIMDCVADAYEERSENGTS